MSSKLESRLAGIQIGSLRYNSPWTQVTILGFVCFCSVGMFSAIGGLGAGGSQDAQLSDIANSVLYGMFALTGFVSGSINNMLGPRLTLSIGTTGYSLYVGSLWAFQVHGTRWFLILAGGILGVTAALLWTAQGSIMMSYPTEAAKGRSFSLFWTVFQMGTLVGAAIALGIQAHSTLPSVSTGVYLAFMIIMLTAIVSSWFVLPPHLVVRDDGTVVKIEKALGPKDEIQQFVKLFKDWRMLALFPMFFSSNYFYSYQGAITAYLFNGRTRALTSLLTGLGSILGSLFIGLITDYLPFKRRHRALGACAAVFILNIIVWTGGIVFQTSFSRTEVGHRLPAPWDWTDGAAVGPLILLMSYYIADAAYQGLAYYTMSAMTNDPFRLARMAGYYKGVQSAGGAISFAMDAVKTPYLTEHIVSWAMLLFSLPLCFWVLWYCKDTNYDTEETVRVEDIEAEKIGGAAIPTGHHLHEHEHATSPDIATDKKDATYEGVRAV